ncbi:MAG: TIGR03084 family protein [Pseudonocardiaceae bacterium]|nr:TIGR03084 family protein [Pseudonocardiaceae bacterium]
MAPTMSELLTDLVDETLVVDEMLTPLDDAAWERPTPAEGWRIRDQVSHLAYFDETAALSATDPDRFRAGAEALAGRGDRFTDEIADEYRALPPAQLREWFRTARRSLVETFAAVDPATRLPWYGPPMSAASSITARLMETWAHGQDIADALGVEREPTARLRHVAHIGVRTFSFAFGLHGRPVPETPVRVELSAPDGTTWTWGSEDDTATADTVRGPALDFCLVVTQRRHLLDTGLQVTGDVAAEWMSLAQAFAGPPGPGRAPSREVTR